MIRALAKILLVIGVPQRETDLETDFLIKPGRNFSDDMNSTNK